MNVYDIAIARALAGGGGGGGGNPNTVETATGDVSNPWGSIDISKLATALENKEASAYMDIDASALGAGTITTLMNIGTSNFYTSGLDINDTVSASLGYEFGWSRTNGNIIKSAMLSGGNIVDLTNYLSALTTTLTVVWHPLP